MSSLYKYYQLTGGVEPWTVCYDTDNLDEKRPTFVTILAVDTILAKDSPKELKDKAKYQGPMYFDLDSEDVNDSIAGAKELIGKLKEKGLSEADMLIYLSGKKGLHIIVPQVCFMPKLALVSGLPAIYKEVAFNLAVDTMDFRVYTGGMGRMFRTCHNIRENGNYKVPVTVSELENLDAEGYRALCAAPREATWHSPQFRTGMALLYDFAAQKVGKIKPKPYKPVPPAVIQQTLPLFGKIIAAEEPLQSGFNNIAMQLSLFAREAGWDEDSFTARCENLIRNHVSDGIRYNTPRKREAELRRMFNYVADNTGLEYNLGGLKALLGRQEVTEASDFQMELSAGVIEGANCYMASKGEDGNVAISNFIFKDIIQLTDRSDRILGLRCKAAGRVVDMFPANFTSSSAMQNAVSGFGGSFTGSDMHARGIYQIMLKQVTERRYIVDSEGINLVKFQVEGNQHEYIVWADRYGVKCAHDLAGSGIGLEFQGYPDMNGVTKTDLITSPELTTWLDGGENQQRLITSLTALLHSHTPEVMGKMVGWAIACFYKPVFLELYGKFPLLHVYGPAGNGKTEMTMGLMQFFFYKNDPTSITPSSTAFAVQTNLSGTTSIPVVLDEYKPHVMAKEKLEMFRAILRDTYNSKEVHRGGGNKSSDKYNALNISVMSAPLAFIAEAPETETAIVERSLMVSFKRLSGKQMANCFRNAMTLYQDTDPLSSIGLSIATEVVGAGEKQGLLAEFDALHRWASSKYLTQPDDYEKFEAGELSARELKVKSMMRPRNVFNASVACFGLSVLKRTLQRYLGDSIYKEHFEQILSDMARSVFLGMDALADATVPEYVKVLQVMSDMTRLPMNDQYKLVDRDDYTLTQYAGETVLVLAARNAYRKYRAYMRYTDTSPLYPGESAFELALRDVPQFIRLSEGTERLKSPSVVMAYEELGRAGVPEFTGKLVSGDFLVK